jgi:hypothetical protein
MKTLHVMGHNNKWNRDIFYENGVGNGFIYTAYTFPYEKIIDESKKWPEQKENIFLDLQFYGHKDSSDIGKFSTYPFHPARLDPESSTNLEEPEFMRKGIEFQKSLGLTNIIIPIIYKEDENCKHIIKVITALNKKLEKQNGIKYFMTLPLGKSLINNDQEIEDLLIQITDMSIQFDGYYIVCEASIQYKQKVSIDFNYFDNLAKVFKVLNRANYETIFGYANFDAVLFSVISNINYISMATYENLRKFNLKKFTETPGGGASEGWYFSSKLLNFIQAQHIIKLRKNNLLHLISNEDNIFSDIILKDTYTWNNHKPEIHKNYLLEINKILHNLNQRSDIKGRIDSLISKIENARKIYADLEDKGIYLPDESSNYHLGHWLSFLKLTLSKI